MPDSVNLYKPVNTFSFKNLRSILRTHSDTRDITLWCTNNDVKQHLYILKGSFIDPHTLS